MRHALLAASILGALAVPAVALAAPSPADLNLRAADLPAGFIRTVNLSQTPEQQAEADHQPVARYRQEGRVLASDVRFERIPAVGIIAVESDLTRFATARQAHAVFAGGNPFPPTVRHLHADGLGEERVAVSFAGPQIADVGYAFGFRRGPYLSVVVVTSHRSTTTPSQALHFAQLVDARIRAGIR